MIGANEGEVLSTADALWPLALLYLVSCGALGVGSLALLRHESKRAREVDAGTVRHARASTHAKDDVLAQLHTQWLITWLFSLCSIATHRSRHTCSKKDIIHTVTESFRIS